MSNASASLPPCPESPNCVSSLAADPRQRVEALAYNSDPASAMRRLVAILEHSPRTVIMKEKGGYLHVEVRSLVFRFVDDLEFLLDEDNSIIHIRSASRTGHSDFGVNRRRVERIRKAFKASE